MYLFISENEVQAYNGEILKRYVGRRLVKTIANPTNKDLKEFGYMELVEDEIPEFNAETQYIEKNYEVIDNVIYSTYIIYDIPYNEEQVEQVEQVTEE